MTNEELEKTSKETQKARAAGDTDAGSKSETTKKIEQTDAENEKLEASLNKRDELLTRQDAISAREQVGGRADAGQEQSQDELDTKEAEDRVAAFQ